MDTIKFEKNKTLVIAHRGLSGLETENTNAAFVAAGNRSYYGIETDVHKTADGKLVVIHDYDLKRVAGVDIEVESTNLADLQDIVLFDKDGGKGREDLRLPTPENYISICKKYNKHSVLELKSHFTKDEIARLIEIIKSYKYLDHVTFISFDYDNLVKVREILPNQSAQFLFSEITEKIIRRLIDDKIDVDVHHKALNKNVIDLLHSKGLMVNCWTVDDKDRAEELAHWGVDYITSNILE